MAGGHPYLRLLRRAVSPGARRGNLDESGLGQPGDGQCGVRTPQEGVRLIANLVDDQFNAEAEANVAIGKRVQVVFQDISEDFTLPQFKLSNEPQQRPLWQFPS